MYVRFGGGFKETCYKQGALFLPYTFQVSERAARDGRNPKTGETIKIAATTVPGFKAGKALKEAVN